MLSVELRSPLASLVTSLRLVGENSAVTELRSVTQEGVITAFNLGLMGPPGPPGPGSETFQFSPSTPTAEWVINHNFGRWPAVTVLNPGGFEVEAEVAHVSLNQSRVYFISPQLGTAIAR